jgi:hypothetical protein
MGGKCKLMIGNASDMCIYSYYLIKNQALFYRYIAEYLDFATKL